MDLEQQQKRKFQTSISTALLKEKYDKVIQIAKQYEQKFGLSKQIYLALAKAHFALNKPKECLINLQNAEKLGLNSRQLSVLKIKSLLELNQTKEVQNAMTHLMRVDDQVKKLFQLFKAVELNQDKFKKYQLSKKQQNILESMKEWLSKAGAVYQKLKVVNLYPDYRGVIATRHIKKKQQIVFIPKSQLISFEMALQNKHNKQIIQKRIKLQSPKHTYLSILLLQLKKAPNSKFKPYIDLLPEDHSCFPINYSKHQLQMLQGSPFLNMIYEKVIDLKRDYEAITKAVPGLQNLYSFKQFCWARMMIGSRIFGLIISGVKTEVLVPFADMLNHRHPKQTMWNYQQSMNGFVIESLQDIQIGQQVFDSYGRKCNSRFLLNYGFILQGNLDNQIALKIVIDEECAFGNIKREMIRQDPNITYTQIKKISMNLTNNKFYELMGCLRFICTKDQQTLNMLKKISNIAQTKQPYQMIRTPPISIKNQILVWQKLGQICQQQLGKYPTSLQQDEKLLKEGRLSQNEKNIITLRMGEKNLLIHHIKICKQVVKILNSQNIIQQLQKHVKQNYARYVYKILCLTPGINKKSLQEKLAPYFVVEQVVQEQLEQVPQS